MSDQTKAKTQKKKLPEKPEEINPEEVPKPTVKLMVNDALTQMKSRKGVSLYAIKEYMTTKYNVDPAKLNFHIKRYIKSGVETGIIIQTKGTGASGSFKLVPVKEKRKKTAKKPNKEKPTKINTSKDSKEELKTSDVKVKKTKPKEDKVKTVETTKKVEEKKVKLVKKNKLIEKIKQMTTPKKGMSKRKSIGSIIKKPKMKPKKLVD